jgi:hypothetical protein
MGGEGPAVRIEAAPDCLSVHLIHPRDAGRSFGRASSDPGNTKAETYTRTRGGGFGHAATVHSELFALNNGRTNWNNRTAVIVDEAAMLDTKLMAMVTAYAHDTGAKLILVGDDRQLSSIDRGGMFGALKDRHGAAALTEVKRQHKIDERRAAEMMAEGNFHDALGIYEAKGAIHWTRTQGEARAELVDQWAKDSARDPKKTRFVFAYTNDDVQQLNAALRAVQKERGELGDDHELATAYGRLAFAAGDRIQFTTNDKQRGIVNGAAGTIEAIDGTHLAVKLDGPEGKVINFDAAAFDQFRHGLAGTIYRGQGDTLDQTYLYHSEHWRSAPSYVALTRHRDKAELFVARNTAPDLNKLARQMARTDDRRAASMFHAKQPIGLVEPLTADEILARFGSEIGRGDRRGPRAAEAAQTQEADRAASPPDQTQERPTAARSGAATAILGSVFDAAERVVTGIFEGLAESIAPTPALTPEQEERQARAIQEAEKQHAEAHRDDEHKERTAKIILDEKSRQDHPDDEIRYDRFTGRPIGDAGRAQEHGRGRGRTRSR